MKMNMMKQVKNAVRAVVAALIVATGVSAQAESYQKYTYVSTQSLTPGGSATAYIKLSEGLLADGDSVETRVQYKDAGATGTECVFCCRIGGTDKGFDLFRIKGEGYRVDYQGQFKSNPKLGLTTDEQIITVGKTSLKVNDDTYSYTGGTLPSLSERAPLLFVCDSSGNGIPSSNQAAMKMFYFRVKDKDGKVKIDLVPAGDSTEKLGLLDDLTGNFYAFEGASATSVQHGEKDNLVPPPVVLAELPYTGEEQIGVLEGQDYTLEGDWKATEISPYTATAKLKDKVNKVWADSETTDDRMLNWEIVKGVNAWTTSPSITKTRFRPGDTNVQLTPGATQHGTVAATIRKDGGDPIAFDGKLSTLELGEYELTYTSVADEHYKAADPVEKPLHFFVTENPDDVVLPGGYTRVGYLSSYENWTGGAGSPYMILENEDGKVLIKSTDQIEAIVQPLRVGASQYVYCHATGAYDNLYRLEWSDAAGVGRDHYTVRNANTDDFMLESSLDLSFDHVTTLSTVTGPDTIGGMDYQIDLYKNQTLSSSAPCRKSLVSFIKVQHPLVVFAGAYYKDGAFTDLTGFARMRLYRLKIWTQEDELNHDLIPCRSPAGVLGLYDVADGTSGSHFYAPADPAHPFTAEERDPVVVPHVAKVGKEDDYAFATIGAQVLGVGEGASSVDVYALYGIEGIYKYRTRLLSGAVPGDNVTVDIHHLDRQTAFSYAIEIVTDTGAVYTNVFGSVTLPKIDDYEPKGPMDYPVDPAERLGSSGQVLDGSISWTGADKAYYCEGDIVLVYTNIASEDATFTIKDLPRPMRLLAVAGGGAGGVANTAHDGMSAAGGGAGGMLQNEAIRLSPDTYTIRVGRGAEPVTSVNTLGDVGENSIITNKSSSAAALNFVAFGGGSGGNSVDGGSQAATLGQFLTNPVCGRPGGSGGGVQPAFFTNGWSPGCAFDGTSAHWYMSQTSVSGQGHVGGRVSSYGGYGGAYQYWTAGGGGAGGAGESPAMPTPAHNFKVGGAGRACTITGEPVIYASGGAGGCSSVLTWSGEKNYSVAPVNGGGGGSRADATAGIAYSGSGEDGLGGGGAGGSAYNDGTITKLSTPGRGGDGVVIVRFENVVLYTISFDLNGGQGRVPTRIENQPLWADLPDLSNFTPPTRAGYAFKGFAVKQEDGQVLKEGRYYDENGQAMRQWDIAADTTLYAVWLPVVPWPEALEDLVYNGSEQDGIGPDPNSYVLVDGTKTGKNAGAYEATVKPQDGFYWADGTTTNCTVKFEIAPRPVKLRSADGTWVYDGAAHSTNEVTVAEDSPYVFADGEGVKSYTDGSFPAVRHVADTGTGNNTFEVGELKLKEGSVPGNYALSYAYGDLKVTKRGGPDDPDEDKNKLHLKPFHDPIAYGSPAPEQSTYTWDAVSGLVGGDGKEQVKGTAVYATDYTQGAPASDYGITLSGLDSDNYVVTFDTGTLTVLPAGAVVVTITGHAATNVYDGTEYAVTGYDFSSSDPLLLESYVDFSGSAEAKGTDAGRYKMNLAPEQFKVKDAYRASFPNVTFNVTDGEQVITRKPVGGDSGVTVGPVEDTYYYNGDGREPEPTVTDAKTGSAQPVEGDDFKYVYEDNTNATETAKVIVDFNQPDGNYSGAVTNAFPISPRTVALVSGSETFVYDGQSHSNLTVTATAYDGDATTDKGHGFVPGEGFTSNVTATIATVADSPKDNAFTFGFAEGTLPENYMVTCVTGKLTMTKATYPGTIEWVKPEGKATFVYDGEEKVFVVKGLPDGVMPIYADNRGTHVSNHVAHVTFEYDETNYYAPVAPADLEWSITKRPLVFTTAGASWEYDGTAHTLPLDKIHADSYAGSETFTYTNLATITDVGKVKATFDYSNGTADTNDYEVSWGTIGDLEVTVSKNQIEVILPSETFAYDGQAHSNVNWTVRNEEILLEGHKLAVEVSPTSVVTTPDEGEVANDFAKVLILDGETDVTKNYNLVKTSGILSVTNANIVVTGAEDFDYEGKYDGQAHGIQVAVPTLTDGTKPAVAYALASEGPFGAEIKSNDVCDVTVWYRLSAPYYNDYTGSATLKILPREVTFTSVGAEKAFDGLPLETDLTKVTLSGDGFVAGEGYELSNPASITEVGQKDATFDVTLKDGTKTMNYTVTKIETAKLRIYAGDAIVVTADTKLDFVFDSAEHTLTTYTQSGSGVLQAGDELEVVFDEASKILRPDETPVGNHIVTVRVWHVEGGTRTDRTSSYSLEVYDGQLGMLPAKIDWKDEDGNPIDITAFGETTVYDAERHSIHVVKPTLLTEPVNVRYCTTRDGTYSETLPEYVDVGTYDIFYEVSADCYYWETNKATVTITNRVVELTSASARKVWDGTPLTTNEVKVTAGSFAGTESFSYNCTGSQTEGGGSCDNTFTYELTNGGKASNYTIVPKYGLLVVDKAEFDFTKPKYELSSYEGAYDAEGHTITVSVPAEDPTYLFSLVNVTAEDAYAPVAPMWTNVTETAQTVYVLIKAPNYNPFYTNATVTITPATVTVTSYDRTFPYDGEPHAFTNLTVTGFVGGDYVASTSNWATVTNLDESKDNSCDWTFGCGELNPLSTLANYAVTTNWGTIKIGQQTAGVIVTITGACDTVTYDGLRHDVSGWGIASIAGEGAAGYLPEYVDVKLGCEWMTATNGIHAGTYTMAMDANTFTNKNSAFSQVTFVVTPGVLAINRKPVGGDSGVTVGPVEDTYYYNGEGHEPEPSVTDVKTGLEQPVEGGDFKYVYEDNTNATETATVIVDFNQPDGNYSGAITNEFRISPRTVTLESGSETFVYDGQAHSNLAVTATAYDGDATPDRGHGFVPGEGFTSNVTGRVRNVSDTHEGNNAFTYELADGTLAMNYVVTTTNGTLTVVKRGGPDDPDEDKNKLHLKPLHEAIDFGEPVPEQSTYTWTVVTGLVEGDTEDQVQGTAAYETAYTQGASVGDYAIELSGLESENYELAYDPGVLTVKAAKLPDPEPKERDDDPSEPKPEGYEGTPFDWYGCYDGNGHTILDLQFAAGAVLTTPRILYSRTEGTGYGEDLVTFVDVTNKAPVYVKVEADNYEPLYTNAFVTITQRVVHVEFPKVTKVYDGTDACPAPGFVVTNLATEAENMVAGEEIDAEGRGHFDTPNVDASAFIVTNVTLTAVGEKTKLSNYLVFVGANGGLLFSTDGEGSGPVTYDGDDPRWPGEPEGPAAIEDAKLPDPQPKEREDDPSEPKPEGYEGTPFDWYGCYDGNGHTILDFQFAAGAVLTEPRVLYSATAGEGYAEELVTFVDVTNRAPVYVKIEAENYGPLYTNAFVTITQRVVHVEFPKVTKVYDGTDACPAPGFVVTNLATEAENMVAGEEIDAEGRGHFDTPNVDASAFIVTNVTLTAVGEKTKLSNYLVFVGANGGLLFSTDGEGSGPVTYDGDDPRWPGEPEGPAEIVPARLPDPQPKEREDDPSEPKPEGYEGTPFDWYGCYDGLEHTILEFVFAPGAVLTEPRVLYSRTEGTGYGEDLVTFVDVTNKAPVYVKVEADNYEPLYTNAFVTITPRSIALALVSVTNNPAGGKIKLGDKLVFTAVDATLPAGSVDLTAADYGEPVWVNTNKVSKPGQTAKLILNGQGNYKDAVTNEFWIYARIAELKAKLAWRQNLGTGKLYAQVRIGCGNLSDDPDPIDQMAFVFPGVDTVPVLRLDKPDTTVDGVPAVTMGTGAVNEMISSKIDWSALYGVSDATFAAPVRTTPVPKAERLIALGSGNFLAPNDADSRLFELWYKSGDEERRVYMTTGEFAARLATMRATERSVTSKDVNDYLAYSLDPESSKNCRLKEFTVTDGMVRGRVVVLDEEGNEAEFGGNVRITILRASSPNGNFEAVGAEEVTVDDEGNFSAKLGGESSGFFRAKVVVEEVIK